MTKRKFIYSLTAILLLVLFDQESKIFFINYLKTKTHYTLEILPFLNFIYAWNYGISFGLFREYYQYSNIIFLITNSLILVYLLYLITQKKGYLEQIGLVLIIGGAIGNLTDRIIRGAVFDFIYFYYNNLSFPAFNMADSFITLGAFILIIDCSFYNKK